MSQRQNPKTRRGPLISDQRYEPSPHMIKRALRWVRRNPANKKPPGHIANTLARTNAKVRT